MYTTARRIIFSILFLIQAPCFAATITVNTVNDISNQPGLCSLRDAVQSAELDTSFGSCTSGSGADVINLPAGTYALNSSITISNDDLDIVGAGQGQTIITRANLQNMHRLFTIYVPENGNVNNCSPNSCNNALSVSFSGMTFQNGQAVNCENGGAIYAYTKSPCNYPHITINDSFFFENINGLDANGGAVAVNGRLTASEANFVSNGAFNGGGALYLSSYRLYGCNLASSISDSNFNTNLAAFGGAIHNDEGANLTISDSNFLQNTAYSPHEGGGAIINQGTLELRNCELNGNEATPPAGGGSGGAIYNGAFDEISQALLTVSDSRIINNTANQSGGGIYNEGDAPNRVTIIRSSISGNMSVVGGGGGIFNNRCNLGLSIVDSEVSGNTAYQGGGGIKNESDASIEKSTISANSCPLCPGGGIFNFGSLNLKNSTISQNTSGSFGAGIANETDCPQSQGQSCFIGNSSNGSTLSNVTVAYNLINPNPQYPNGSKFFNGAGIGVYCGEVSMRNTIVAKNTDNSPYTPLPGEQHSDAPDCWRYIDPCSSCSSSLIRSECYSLIGDATGCNFSSSIGDQIGNAANPIDPLLASLTDNGGKTDTHALTFESPALDSANPAAPGSTVCACEETDQRGVLRPQAVINENQAICDIGAYELIVERDCLGVINGPHILDSQEPPVCCMPNEIDVCGVCFGDGSSCADPQPTPTPTPTPAGPDQCVETSYVEQINILTANVDDQWRTLRRSLRLLARCLKADQNKRDLRFVKRSRRLGRAIVAENLNIISSYAPQTLECSNTDNCVSTNNVEAKAKFIENSNILFKKTRRALSRLRRCQSGGSCSGSISECKKRVRARNRLVRKLRRKGINENNINVNYTNTLPDNSINCQ